MLLRQVHCPRKSSSLGATRRLSTTSPLLLYRDTIQNLKIGAHTRVIFQGFTGKQATANAVESRAWGTNIVGGVTPGREGMHPVLQDLPVYPTVRSAVDDNLKPDATGIYVAAHQAAGAIEEAIEAEIPLIVAVAEHIPLHDMLRIHSMLKSQSKSRLVGANAPGIISPLGRCRIGFQPLPAFSPGHIGVVAKSGTLSYETVASLTRAGLGQSLCIGMGGDVVAGTDFVDALRVFERDEDTHGIIIVGEVGGMAEEEAAEWISSYRQNDPNPKPIAALVAGKIIKPGYVMGHAGAWAGRGENSADEKYRILQDAGAVMVDHPSHFGRVMEEMIGFKSKTSRPQTKPMTKIRQYHTHVLSSGLPAALPRLDQSQRQERRALHYEERQASAMLESEYKVFTARPPASASSTKAWILSLTIDRSNREPCFLLLDANPESTEPPRRIPVDRNSAGVIHTALGFSDVEETELVQLLVALEDIFYKYEAVAVEIQIHVVALTDDNGARSRLWKHSPRITFDDAAFRSGGRHEALHASREVSREVIDPAELDAEEDGIVYVKLGDEDDPSYNIGTLVNGAGLAMNTVDALALPPHNAKAANFLDTGGKATAETVKKSFALLLRDKRVKVVFVNIFGGLTLGDMIARGILLAFRELRLGEEERGVPVVVRIRGTNEEEGQRILRESGLGIWAFDGFDEAAAKCVELAKEKAREEEGRDN